MTLSLFAKEELIITGDNNYAPYSYTDINGNPKGLLVDVGKQWGQTTNIIKNNHTQCMAEQQTIFMMEMREWESVIADNDRNDDITIIGFEIDKQSKFILNNKVIL